MHYGSAWYPEHWDQSLWAPNLKLMRQAGMNVVRVAEFAWSQLEPADNVFSFDWLEQAIALAADHGLATVIGTPTASAPAWLTHAWPEVLAVRESGRPERHGGRGHHSPASPRYRFFCQRIAEQLARRFGQNPHVIGWHIDNEYWPYSFDPHTLNRFQLWLKDRYTTLDALNRAWSNTYWSQEYSDWSQIPAGHGWQNPCLLHAAKLFASHIVAEFQQIQLDAIRAHAHPRQWITHNFHAHKNLDFAAIAAPLDFVSWDPYVGTGHLEPDDMGATLDFCRGIQQKPFWIMETQPVTVNWASTNNPLDRGEVRRIIWQAVGHGADAILYWQWQNPLGGQEQYHGSLIGPGGHPRPFFHEASQIGQELARTAHLLDGTRVQPSVAILDSYPDRWAIDAQRHHANFDPLPHLVSFYKPLRQLGLDVDILQPTANLQLFPLIIAPHLHLLDPSLIDRLTQYVHNGGHLLLGPRSGFKDPHNALLSSRQPGTKLGELLGAWVEEYYALDKPVPLHGQLGNGQASIWAEYLSTSADTQVLLRYGTSNGWLDNQPAAVTRPVGKGRITYFGAWADAPLMSSLMQWACSTASIPVTPLPPGIERCRRVAADREITILLNHSTIEQSISLPPGHHDLLHNHPAPTLLPLPPGQLTVLSRPL